MTGQGTMTGKVFGGEHLRDQRDRYLALRRRLQSNGSQSARQKLRQVSGKEARRVKHINHQTSKAIVQAAIDAGIAKITMEDLTHIRERIKELYEKGLSPEERYQYILRDPLISAWLRYVYAILTKVGDAPSQDRKSVV